MVSSDSYFLSSFFVLSDGPALLLLNLVTSNMRNCHRPTSKVMALELISDLLPHLTDEAKLDRIVPFVIAMLTDESPGVRSRGITSLVEIVSDVLTNASSVVP